MQLLGRRHVGQLNARHGRTGTLWEDRCKACLVGSERYVLKCARNIDLTPVRARITDNSTRYQGSSGVALFSLQDDLLLSLHYAQAALGSTCRD